VDEGERHQERHQRQGQRQLPRRPEPPERDEEQRAHQQLHQRVAPGDGRPAGPALPPQREEGDERDVLVPAQRVAALRAAGPGPGDVLPGGEAGDDDVEEAPHAEAEHEQPGGEEGLHRSRGVYERAWRSANTWVSPSSTAVVGLQPRSCSARSVRATRYGGSRSGGAPAPKPGSKSGAFTTRAMARAKAACELPRPVPRLIAGTSPAGRARTHSAAWSAARVTSSTKTRSRTSSGSPSWFGPRPSAARITLRVKRSSRSPGP